MENREQEKGKEKKRRMVNREQGKRSKEWKFIEVHVLFQKLFFWHESQPAGPITKTKTVNVE